jgi:hypothetical protein
MENSASTITVHMLLVNSDPSSDDVKNDEAIPPLPYVSLCHSKGKAIAVTGREGP